jgi:hypothetical protein
MSTEMGKKTQMDVTSNIVILFRLCGILAERYKSSS